MCSPGVLLEEYEMTLAETKRLLRYMDMAEPSLSMDAMVHFISSGLELNRSNESSTQ